MLVNCPSCNAPIKSKPLAPGSYTPKCPKCQAKFSLVVGETDRTVMVSKPSPPKQQAPAADPNATGAFDGRTDADRSTPYRPEPEGTGVFEPSAAGHGATEVTGGFDPNATAAQPYRDDLDATADLPPEPKPKKGRAKPTTEMPDRLGGYELVKQLGAGGMGAVFLARQTSLDRPVALKVMHAQWAKDPLFLARFTREAYAAAQLNHHNVVQIYDFGEDAGVNYFSMEFVEGKSIGDLFKKSGKLDPATAVGYVIQAAKGLKFAHDRGMIHRDIKPDNLMLNAEGLVKVADLGLVKTRTMTKADDAAPAGGLANTVGGTKIQQSANVTTVGSAMGSPLYMAPEQCRDATAVDGRADVYSLGCTLFALLSGRTPFTGTSPMEVILKHQNDPPPPLRSVAPDVPAKLAGVVDKTLRKDPAERFQSMDQLIDALKAWQEADKAGPPRPTPDQVTLFEGLAGKVAGAGAAKLAALLALAVPAGLVGLGAVALFASPAAGGAMVLAGLAAVPAGLVTASLVGRSHLFRTARRWAFGLRALDWATLAAAAVLFVAGLSLGGFLVYGLAGVIAGALLGVGWAYVFIQPTAARQEELRTDMDGVLRRLRLAGMDEDAVRDFAATAAGANWPAVYELLFGYPAMDARRGPDAPRGLRDKLIAWFEAKVQARQERRAKRHLQKLERKRLEAEGVSAAEAKSQARDAADDLVEQGAVLRQSARETKPTVNVGRIMTRYERARLTEIRKPRPSPLAGVAAAAFDPRLRLLVGALLMVGGLMWASQNRQALAAVEAEAGTVTEVQSAVQAQKKLVGLLEVLTSAKTKPLQAKLLPDPLAGLFDSFNPVAAGLLLILTTLSTRTAAILAASAAAAACLLLHKLVPLPPVGPLTPSNLTLLAGLGVGLAALVLVRRR